MKRPLVRVVYHARTALGDTLVAMPHKAEAEDWARRHLRQFPSIHIVKQTLTVAEEVVYRPGRPARQSEIAA